MKIEQIKNREKKRLKKNKHLSETCESESG